MEYDLNKPHVTLEVILLELERLEGDFLILSKSEEEYLQVLTIGNKYTVEIRLITVHDLIRQYRIGLNPSSEVWHHVLNTVSGQISLKESEFLSKNDVKIILKDYVNDVDLVGAFYKRNISKEIGLM